MKHMPSFQVCFRARAHALTFSSVIRGMQVFPKLNRADAQGSAADYLRFVSEMYIAAPRFNLDIMSRDCCRLRQRDLSLLGPSITLDQFSQKMWEVITANDFYDHHHWVPGPLGRRDPVFQTLMFALWTMVSAGFSRLFIKIAAFGVLEMLPLFISTMCPTQRLPRDQHKRFQASRSEDSKVSGHIKASEMASFLRCGCQLPPCFSCFVTQRLPAQLLFPSSVRTHAQAQSPPRRKPPSASNP